MKIQNAGYSGTHIPFPSELGCLMKNNLRGQPLFAVSSYLASQTPFACQHKSTMGLSFDEVVHAPAPKPNVFMEAVKKGMEETNEVRVGRGMSYPSELDTLMEISDALMYDEHQLLMSRILGSCIVPPAVWGESMDSSFVAEAQMHREEFIRKFHRRHG